MVAMRDKVAKWFRDALSSAGISQASISSAFYRFGVIGTEDRSVANKIAKERRDLTAAEMLITHELTGYPLPTKSNSLAEAIESLPPVAKQRAIDYVALLKKMHEAGVEIEPAPVLGPISLPPSTEGAETAKPDQPKRH